MAESTVTLRGGPMHGWIVKRDAPALRPDWWTTWPPSVAKENQPGYYRLTWTGDSAKWEVTTVSPTRPAG